MSYNDKLKLLGELKGKADGHGPLSQELLNKINYKLRLEWNYTSNSMEGNTLTKAETRSVMIGNITVHGKPIKDVLEVKGHDEVISNIMRMGRGELNISEKRIKEIHAGIMHEEDPEKKAMIGVWKKQPNHVINYKGEKFEFVAPADVQQNMHALINWLTHEREKADRFNGDGMHPVTIALKFHLDYVTIHPFYDGNGRTSRILTNILLIAYGYPPIYIKENERQQYMQYIADIQGYGGDTDVFYEFMAGLVLRSQQLVLDAIAGKDIDEPDDIDKEIALWKKTAVLQTPNALKRNDDIIYDLYYESLKPMYDLFLIKHAQLSDMFSRVSYYSFKNGNGADRYDYLEEKIDEVIARSRSVFLNAGETPEEDKPEDTFLQIYKTIRLEEYKYSETAPFTHESILRVNFEPYKYSIVYSHGQPLVEKKYHDILSEEEQKEIVSKSIKRLFEEIKQRTQP